VAPLRADLARQMYLEKRRAHAELDRHATVQALRTTVSQWVDRATQRHYQTALDWIKLRRVPFKRHTLAHTASVDTPTGLSTINHQGAHHA
jgi:hypothetical protein